MAKYGDKQKEVVEGNEQLEEMIADSERLHDLKVVLDMPGGKMLVEALLEKVIHSVNSLSSKYSELSHTELISLCATLESNLSLVNILYGAKESEKIVDEMIKDMLKGQ